MGVASDLQEGLGMEQAKSTGMKGGETEEGEGGESAAAAAALADREAQQVAFMYTVPCTEHPHGGVEHLSGGRSKRVPGGHILKNPRFQEFLQHLRDSSTSIGQAEGRVLRLKQYISADARPQVIDAVLDALEENRVVEALYIQNFEKGMFDAQLEHLQKVLRNKQIWALNVGENFEISLDAWSKFTAELPSTAVAYLYVSEHHLLRTDLKVKMRDAIRENRNVAPPRDPQVISRIGNMWYNPKLPAGYNAAAAAWQKKGVRRHGHLLRARVPPSRRVIEAEGEDGGHGNGCRKRPLPASSHSPLAKRTKATVSGKTTSQAHPSGRKSPKGKAALAAPSALKLPSPATLTSSAVAKEQRVERSHLLASQEQLPAKPSQLGDSSVRKGGKATSPIGRGYLPSDNVGSPVILLPPSNKYKSPTPPHWHGKRPRSQRAFAPRSSENEGSKGAPAVLPPPERQDPQPADAPSTVGTA